MNLKLTKPSTLAGLAAFAGMLSLLSLALKQAKTSADGRGHFVEC
jgi:hypothetical protein